MSNPVVPLTPEQEALREQQAEHQDYIRRQATNVDEYLNVLTGGNMDETISSRVGRDAEAGHEPAILLAKFLDLFQKDHVADANAGDLGRAQKIVGIEENSGNLPKNS